MVGAALSLMGHCGENNKSSDRLQEVSEKIVTKLESAPARAMIFSLILYVGLREIF
jgi:hypothetical protein